MPNLGPIELGLIVLILLLIIGPGKLSGLGSSLGKSIREFRKATQEPEEESAPPPSARAKAVEARAIEEPRPSRAPTVTLDDEPKGAASDGEART